MANIRGSLAVVSQSGKSLSFFELSSGKRTALMSDLIAEPHELCFDKKRNLMYLSHAYRHGHFWAHGDCSHEISVVDPVRKQIVDTIDVRPNLSPHGLTIDAEKDILYSSYEEVEDGAGESATRGGVMAIDLKTRKIVEHVGSGAKSHWFVITPDGKKAFTCNKTASFISVLDMENERMIGKIPVDGTEEPAISLDGRFAYFPTPGASLGESAENPRLLVIDTATNEVVKQIQMKHGAQGVHVTSTGKILVGQYFASKEGIEGKLAVYDGKTHEFLGDTKIGGLPLTLRSSHDGWLAFTANILLGSVSVVDLSSMSVVQTLGVDNVRTAKGALQGSHGMVFFPEEI